MDCPRCGAANLERATKCADCEAELPTVPRRRGWLLRHPLVTAVAGALVAGIIGGLFLLLKPSGGDVVLIPVDRSQNLPFVPGTNDPHTPNRNVAPAIIDAPGLGGQVADGTTPGAYGRSGDGASCNVDALVHYLTDPAHAAQAKTWAGIIGITPDAIPTYFAKLTPVRLRFDTRVTNYDYKNGNAAAFQAVLQAGTSVLVDNRGVPRVKCNCGNPLSEPAGSTNAAADVNQFASNPEDAWKGFEPQKVVTFSPGHPVDQLTLLDLDDGTAYQRYTGSTETNDTPIDRGNSACATLAQSASCGGPGPQTTPEDTAALEQTLRDLSAAVRNHDCNTLVNSLSSATLTKLGLGQEQLVTGCQQAFRLLDSIGGVTVNDIKIVSQNGAHATVSETDTINGQTVTGEGRLVRENGNWKVEIPL